MTLFIGIDPGSKGALAVIDGATVAVTKAPMLATGGHDWAASYAHLKSWVFFDNAVAVLEHVQYMQGDGGKGSFTFGGSFHGWQAVIACLGLPLILVRPQQWKKTVLYGIGHEKADAIAYARRTWPGVPLRATARCTKDDDNFAEALCLAEYGRRTWIA